MGTKKRLKRLINKLKKIIIAVQFKQIIQSDGRKEAA